jgi:peptide/nickel transport system permease protein
VNFFASLFTSLIPAILRAISLRRIIILIPTVLGVVTLVFFLIHMIPGDPVELMLGETASPSDLDKLRSDLGLDRPLAEQYGLFLTGLVRADLGDSYYYRRPVADVILEKLPATLELAGAAMAMALLIALPLGVAAAVRKDSFTDRSAMFASLVGISMPNFWLGPLLIILFSLKLGWLPVSGREGPASVILPAVTLGTALAALLSRMTRSAMLDVLGEDYLRTARAKGLAESAVIGRHALRNAMLPVLTIVGLQFGALLSGAVVTENVFAWPGLGTLLIQAINTRDYPLVQGCVLLIALGYVLANFVTDTLYALSDPRVRL